MTSIKQGILIRITNASTTYHTQYNSVKYSGIYICYGTFIIGFSCFNIWGYLNMKNIGLILETYIPSHDLKCQSP